MNDSRPSEPNPEDGEPASFAEKAKNLFQKHGGTILAVGGVIGLAVLASIAVASLPPTPDAETPDIEDSEPSPGLEDAGQSKRKGPAGHDVDATVVKLPAGQNASEERRSAYKEEKGEDLPEGHTYRSKHRRGDQEENGGLGEAAA
ncbi:hypothetical protein ACWGKU_20455 [Kitasatospora sp. NPDC054768]